LIVCLLLIAFLLVWSIPLIVILYLIFSIILNNSKKKEHEIQS
jgi:phage shock protein PspC (stress-responsive transcriptional regulator)